ncbi:MAG: DUF1269 domain-containing protein [Chthoniobacter sp.]|nr:DUF1269 domain-containing protein [Chthoniobacter sp.]
MPNPHTLSPATQPEPGRLVVLGFADENGAFALRDLLSDLEDEGVIEIGDAVIATRNARGKVRLHQSIPLIAAHIAVGSFTGLVMGMLLLNPLFGALAGAGAGALSGAFGDAGIDDAFMKKLGETLTPGSSALFLIVRNTKPEKLVERLQPFAGRCKVLQSTMSAENEAILRNLMEGEIAHPNSALSVDASKSTP